MSISLKLSLINEYFSVCKLKAGVKIPDWLGGSFFSLTSSVDELSIVCESSRVPADVPQEPNWRCLKVEGPLDFSLVGILDSLTGPLARKGISIFAVSTFDTDYVLIKQDRLVQAIAVLRETGHQIN